jgi:Flp pilus assembly protein TadD
MQEMTVKARLRSARSIVAVTVLFLGATPVASVAQATRAPNPNAPRLVVGTFRSNDKKLSVEASEEMRSRLNSDIPMRQLTVLSSADYKMVVEQSGYPYDEALTSNDMNSLAKALRTDEYMEGTVEKTATGYKLTAVLVLTRDMQLSQPLPVAEGDKLSRVAAALSRSVQDARKQIEFEKKCNMAGRDNKPADALAAARAGVVAYPQGTLVRLCELQVRAGYKQPPDSVIVAALEVLKYDPTSKLALTSAAAAYKEKGDKDKATEILIQLLATDPSNTRLVDDVVNSLAASGKSAMAKPIISQAIKDNPGDVRLMKLGFLIYLDAKDYKNGTALGEEMVKIDTTLADTTFFEKMAAAYESDSSFAKAAEVAARGVAKFPSNTTLLGVLGQGQLKSGQQQQAIATFRKILAINPKEPRIRMMIANTYDEMKQPDSTFVALREAKAAGEDGQTVGTNALIIGNRLFKEAQAAFKQAQQSKTPEDSRASIDASRKVIPWVQFADSTLTSLDSKNSAGFLMAASAYFVSAIALTEAPKTKSCEMAKIGQQYVMIAMLNMNRGGKVAPEFVAQLMPVLPGYMTGADQYVKLFCK